MDKVKLLLRSVSLSRRQSDEMSRPTMAVAAAVAPMNNVH
jgi:hypothetical protein